MIIISIANMKKKDMSVTLHKFNLIFLLTIFR